MPFSVPLYIEQIEQVFKDISENRQSHMKKAELEDEEMKEEKVSGTKL